MVQINMSIPESCAECRLSVRHFGKLYCPPLNDRVGNEGKDSRCPLVDAEGEGDLISRADALNCFHDWIDQRGDVHTADEMPEYQRIENLPSAQPEIIRCKDCRHWDRSWTNDFAPNYHYCPFVDGTRRDDFYCADAERRTDE